MEVQVLSRAPFNFQRKLDFCVRFPFGRQIQHFGSFWCGADSIVMGKHSFLGPIDPQLTIPTVMGHRSVAAQNILNQFEMAKEDLLKNVPPSAWQSSLQSYSPDLLASCRSGIRLSEDIVRVMLAQNMFKGFDDAEDKAKNVASWLADHQNFFSHGRFISRAELLKKNYDLKILPLEKLADNEDESQELQALVLSIFHWSSDSTKPT